ncbi:thiamine transporter [Actinobacillus pleuropneumoniae]|nr:thiamine transporter [Actinobacillus pleuropneumoniae]
MVIFALIGFWGNSGWIAAFLQWLGIEWQFQLYGLQGILLAHVFF